MVGGETNSDGRGTCEGPVYIETLGLFFFYPKKLMNMELGSSAWKRCLGRALTGMGGGGSFGVKCRGEEGGIWSKAWPVFYGKRNGFFLCERFGDVMEAEN